MRLHQLLDELEYFYPHYKMQLYVYGNPREVIYTPLTWERYAKYYAELDLDRTDIRPIPLSETRRELMVKINAVKYAAVNCDPENSLEYEFRMGENKERDKIITEFEEQFNEGLRDSQHRKLEIRFRALRYKFKGVNYKYVSGNLYLHPSYDENNIRSFAVYLCIENCDEHKPATQSVSLAIPGLKEPFLNFGKRIETSSLSPLAAYNGYMFTPELDELVRYLMRKF